MTSYWMDEVSGVLAPVVEAYLKGEPLDVRQCGILRSYFRQWMAGPWFGPGVDDLRARIDTLGSRAAITDWLDRALVEGIDPL